MIRYQSLSMPVMILSEVNYDREEDKINVEGDDEKSGGSDNKGPDDTTDGRCGALLLISKE